MAVASRKPEFMEIAMNHSFKSKLRKLSDFHRENCAPYRHLCEGLGEDIPLLPVRVFKETDLKSVPEETIVTCLTSSGTSGQRPSKIYLDAETAAAQQLALSRIAAGFLSDTEESGGSLAGVLSEENDGRRFRRMPMLIIDTPDVLKKRGEYSARAAGILGFSVLSTKRYYALNEQYDLNEAVLRQFLEETAGKPFFVFGFTWVIWKYFYEPLANSGKRIDLSGGCLIHGGGWKKMQELAVSREVFREEIKKISGITRISDYYGMAEQTGSIFMECECGHLHTSEYSDIHFLRPSDFSECERMEQGLIAVDSLLPKSYPGHRLLTEDMGYLVGKDDCPCGRSGKYFHVTGRIPQAELRGCSDTFAASLRQGAASDGAESGREGTASGKTESTQDCAVSEAVTLLAGSFPTVTSNRPVYDTTVLDFLDALSKKIRQLPEGISNPEVKAFGFWCRRRHLEKMRAAVSEAIKAQYGLGMVLHIAPSNMPLMFAYSWAVSLLAGNSNVVRISEKRFPETDMLCGCIDRLLQEERFRPLKAENSIIRFSRNDDLVQKLMLDCDACMIWGGDATVQHMTGLAEAVWIEKDGQKILAFPDKYSVAVISAKWAASCSREEQRMMADRFYRDTYAADQNACSSPHAVFWYRDGLTDAELEEAKNRWWDALAKEAERYPMDAWRAAEKYGKICMLYFSDHHLNPLQCHGNRLFVAEWKALPELLEAYRIGTGTFFEYTIDTVCEIEACLTEKLQTVVAIGVDADQLKSEIRDIGCAGVDRVVPAGEALEFDIIWDGKNLLKELSGND